MQDGYRHNKAAEFSRTQARPPFVTMAEPCNENRFTLPEKYDKSTYLTKVRRATSVVPFERHDGRDSKLIDKGGNSGIDLDGKTDMYYNVTEPKMKQMEKLDTHIPKMTKMTNRKAEFRNMYRQDRDLSPDHYDSVKIAQIDLKTKRKTSNFVNMKKASKRDFNLILNTNAMYKNI